MKIQFAGLIYKDRSEGGVRRALQTGVIPSNRMLIESDCPFTYPNVGPGNTNVPQGRPFTNPHFSTINSEFADIRVRLRPTSQR
jgi:Tat protein secretion system quality control protein TatD with DNase activity